MAEAGLVYGFGAFLQNNSEGQLFFDVNSPPPSGTFSWVNGALHVKSVNPNVAFTSQTDVTLSGPATVGSAVGSSHPLVTGFLWARAWRDITGIWIEASVVDASGALLWATGPVHPPRTEVAVKLAFLLVRKPIA